MARFLVPSRSRIVRWRGTLEGLLPQDHLARFIWDHLISFDFSELEAHYKSIERGPGRSPYHPRLLCALWIYGMSQGLETAAEIAQACTLRDDFRWLTGGLCPSDQTLLNFVRVAATSLPWLWTQMLLAMQQAGHIDLSVVVEDGTKLHANASMRSFHTGAEIDVIIAEIEKRLTTKLQGLGEKADTRPGKIQIQAIERQLARAQAAAAVLQDRVTPPEPPSGEAAPTPSQSRKFSREDFQHDPERDVYTCPEGRELPFVGVYGEDGTHRGYRLYRTRSCTDCRRKAECTDAPRRGIKVPIDAMETTRPSLPSPGAAPGQSTTPMSSTGESASITPAEQDARQPKAPQASVTEPEARMMLGTAEKVWQPSYNADLTVTRQGIIVNQFLTTNPTDFPNFRRALPAVLSTLGRPDAWVGDTHYGTQENMVLAHRAGVVLYAPPVNSKQGTKAPPAPAQTASGGSGSIEAGIPLDDTPAQQPAPACDAPVEAHAQGEPVSSIDPTRRRFSGSDFQHPPDRDVLICPAGRELRLIGIYHQGRKRIYGRGGCRDCHLKARCTNGTSRRVSVATAALQRGDITAVAQPRPSAAAGEDGQERLDGDGPPDLPAEPVSDLSDLVYALEARMDSLGERVRKFRGATCEPVNGQLRQHGLRRLHVHGRARCEVVLGLGCMTHNFMKWKAREAARDVMQAAA